MRVDEALPSADSLTTRWKLTNPILAPCGNGAGGCGLYAKIRRNGTFRTGMKKRISAPVDVLKSCQLKLTPGFTTVASDPPSGTNADGPWSSGPGCTWPAS